MLAVTALMLAADPTPKADVGTTAPHVPTADPWAATPGATAANAPARRGTGLIIAGSILAFGGFTGKVISSATVRPGGYTPDQLIGAGMESRLGGVIVTPALATGLGLLAGGLARRAKWQAHIDVARGELPRRNYRRRAVAGWALLGVGLGVWTVTRVLPFGCSQWVPPTGPNEELERRGNALERCDVGILEAGFYPSLALVSAGIALAPYATGYRAGRKKAAQISWAPTLSRTSAGLSISGRF